MKKLWKSIFATLLILPIFIGLIFAKPVDATTPATVPVTLHKMVFKDAFPDDYPRQNTGDVMPDFAGTPLDGAEFTAYDVTTNYQAALANSDQATAQQAVIAAYQADPAAFTAKATVTTANGGLALFDLEKVSGGKDAAYLFIETATPATTTVTQKALPLVLAFPVFKFDTETNTFTETELDAVHLYPKNITAEDTKTVQNLTDFTMIGTDGTLYNMERGQKVNFRVTLNIPADIADIKYSVTDTPSAGLTLVADTFATTPALATASYTLTSNADGGFTFALDESKDDVKALAGKTLILDYQMELTKDLVPDTIEGNIATVKIGDTTQPSFEPKEDFETGGKKILKIDKHSGKTLAGAEFIVLNAAGKYGEFELNAKNEYALIGWVDGETAKTKVASLADGTVNVIGLKDGTYTLNETKAPSDQYVAIPDGTITFVVKAGTYTTAAVIDVPNTPKGLLPSTGGNGIYAFIGIGAMLMVGAYFWFKKSKEQAEI